MWRFFTFLNCKFFIEILKTKCLFIKYMFFFCCCCCWFKNIVLKHFEHLYIMFSGKTKNSTYVLDIKTSLCLCFYSYFIDFCSTVLFLKFINIATKGISKYITYTYTYATFNSNYFRIEFQYATKLGLKENAVCSLDKNQRCKMQKVEPEIYQNNIILSKINVQSV